MDAPRKFGWPQALLVALLPLLGWWATGLFDLDEGFYGAVTAEMNRRGEWITPFYNGKPWFEKPILLYWLAKPCLALFGDQWGPRLPSVLASLGTLALVGWYARRRLSADAAALSVLILGSCLLMVGPGRMMLTDPVLLLCLTGAFLTFWESLVGDRRWRLASAALLGLSVLAKGPVGILLFAPLAGWTFWREKELRPKFKGEWFLGTAILLIVVASWYLPAYLVNRQVFVQKFLVEQNLERFTGGDQAHTLGFLVSLPFFVPVLILGMLPWSAYLFTMRRTAGQDAFHRYLAAWAIVVFAFFSLSGAKLIHYVMPCVPPLAMLIAERLIARRGLTKGLLGAAVAWTVAVAVLANAGFYAWYQASGQAEAHRLARYARAQGGSVAIYQMGRREHDMGTGSTRLRETSLPSLLLYLNATALDTDSLPAILQSNCRWVLTREGRIAPPDLRAAAAQGKLLQPAPIAQDHFRLYEVVPAKP